MTAHRGITKRQIQRRVADLHPMLAAATRDDDCIAPVFGEDLQYFCCVHHVISTG
jgi:hypothetical protein